MDSVKFTPPNEFTMPEGIKPGGTFDAVSTFRIESDGKCCLIQIGDAKMPGYDGKMQTHAPGYGDYVKSMQTAEPE